MNNTIDTSQLLTQMRAMAATAEGQPASPVTNGVSGDFGSLLKQSIDSVNGLQKTSGRLGDAFVMGDSSISLAEVMVAKQKAGIAFEATMQVRNKLLSAYKEIMAMQV
ncbi:MAG: flagellar hook-basal body complex protein FliE [Gammaproteobacteria bacterium]|nr:flagellar hook-basal body complex protein FliE [Gammaproteobacteria bacterium]